MPEIRQDPLNVEPSNTKPSPACGRIDEHRPHIHHTHRPGPRTPLRCPGTPVTEGGQRS